MGRLRFPTVDGRAVTGADVRVVLRRGQWNGGMPRVALAGRDLGPEDAFWYCVGPGPAWYLVIPLSWRRGFGWKVEWVVRPLDERRLRAALDGDRQALRLAVGEEENGKPPA